MDANVRLLFSLYQLVVRVHYIYIYVCMVFLHCGISLSLSLFSYLLHVK